MTTTPPDPTWRERVAESFSRQAMMRTLGVELRSVAPGEVVLAFERDDRFTQQHGLVHGGVLGRCGPPPDNTSRLGPGS